MKRLHPVLGTFLVTMTASLAAFERNEHPGKISGTVVNSTTGKPIPGAYVGIGDFGDAGGTNLGRFREQGLYVTTETDERGRFVMQGAAVPGEHPLVVTHPEFVRHDQMTTLQAGKPEIDIKVGLRPAATIRVTAIDNEGHPLNAKLLMRLEALDGRRFVPPGRHRHLSSFASNSWSLTAGHGSCSFGELDAGKYAIDAMAVTSSSTVYHGGLANVSVHQGEVKDVLVQPTEDQNRVMINVPAALAIPEFTVSGRKVPAMVVISRNLALLAWDDGRMHHPEDHRLGRIVQSAYFQAMVTPGQAYMIHNLPPGQYSVFAGPVLCMRGERLNVASGSTVELKFPSGRPKQAAQVSLWPLNRRMETQEKTYTTRELCEFLTAKTDGKVQFQSHPSIREETVRLRSEEQPMWDFLESLYLEKGWKFDEQEGGALVLLPETIAKSLIAARQEENTDTGPPPIALLYHEDSALRIRAVYALAATRDPSLIDDLIRAQSVEFYTPVHNAYHTALRSMTDGRTPPSGSNWKAWLAAEVAAGRLEIDYLPVDVEAVDPEQRDGIQPFARQLAPEKLDATAAALLAQDGGSINYEGLRYMVANDYLPEVRQFLESEWSARLLAHPSLNINTVACRVNGLANPGLLRDQINAQVRSCLESENTKVVANTLHLLAGTEGFSTVFTVPGVEPKLRELTDSPIHAVARQARRAMDRINPLWNAEQVSYETAFQDLHETLGREYPCFDLKGINWEAVGKELLPRATQAETDEQFGLLCLELVARLEDSHALVAKGTRDVPWPPVPRWDPGFACLLDDRRQPVVYHVDKGGPAEAAGVKIGMTVQWIDGTPAVQAVEKCMKETCKYSGYSSQRYLQYQAARWFVRQKERGTVVALEMQDVDGQTHTYRLPASLGVRYLPRLPVQIPGVSDAANVSWTMLDENIGYIYVRRIRGDLITRLDLAVGALKDARGLIVDVRGNSGGGFDSRRSFRNFDNDDVDEPIRPRFRGPMALLIDARCISAGEGWASWFIANKRARVFGEATAGASSRKRTYTLKNGFYVVTFPVKAYRGSLNRPIERRGLESDVPVRQTAKDLASGTDTVLEAGRRYLLEHPQ